MYLPCIFGISGKYLNKEEYKFFEKFEPFGYILFERNIDSPNQVKKLTESLREIHQISDLPILIDQEGGRVSRLTPPNWKIYPPASFFGDLYSEKNMPEVSLEAVRLNARLIANDLFKIGINVNCAPVLDVRYSFTHSVIGNRSFSNDSNVVSEISKNYCQGLLDGGVLPVIKHIPGHGRATADSHLVLPKITSSVSEMQVTDFLPFKKLNYFPIAMTAHILYSDIDDVYPATTSKLIINNIIRNEIGFNGLLLTDDISSNMKALTGTDALRAKSCIDSGCDVVLHCDGNLESMEAVAKILPKISEISYERWQNAKAFLKEPEYFDREFTILELKQLLGR